MRVNSHFLRELCNQYNYSAGAEGIEPPSSVLETDVLPLNQAPVNFYSEIAQHINVLPQSPSRDCGKIRILRAFSPRSETRLRRGKIFSANLECDVYNITHFYQSRIDKNGVKNTLEVYTLYPTCLLDKSGTPIR